MARGNNSRDGRAAKSELSRSLRDKARGLLEDNENEKAEAEKNENEYDKALKSAYARAEDDTDEEFKGKRMSVDEEQQSKREAESAKVTAEAEAEEARERAELDAKQAREIDIDKVKSDLRDSPHPYSNDGYGSSKWSQGFKSSIGREGMPFDTDTQPKNREYLTQEYIDKSLASAPASIKEAAKYALEYASLKGNKDLMKATDAGSYFFSAENLGVAFDKAYLKGAFGKNADKGSINVDFSSSRTGVGTPSGEPVTTKQHTAGMKAMQKLDTFLGKVFKGAKGNTERHPTWEDENE
jgi:hypothetical protein